MQIRKSIRAVFMCLLLITASMPRVQAARVGRTITVVAGTPVQISTQRLIVRRILIQMLASGSGGIGYVMDGVPVGTTPVALTNPTAQLCAATASSPGCSYSDSSATANYDIDLQKIWIDGAHSGDTILVSYETAQ